MNTGIRTYGLNLSQALFITWLSVSPSLSLSRLRGVLHLYHLTSPRLSFWQFIHSLASDGYFLQESDLAPLVCIVMSCLCSLSG